MANGRSADEGLNRFNQLDPVAKWIIHVAPRTTAQRLILDNPATGIFEPTDEIDEVADEQSRVRLSGWPEILLHPQMNLEIAALEPAAASLGQVVRLGDLGKAKERAVEVSRRLLTSLRHGELDMIEAFDTHGDSGFAATSPDMRYDIQPFNCAGSSTALPSRRLDETG